MIRYYAKQAYKHQYNIVAALLISLVIGFLIGKWVTIGSPDPYKTEWRNNVNHNINSPYMYVIDGNGNVD